MNIESERAAFEAWYKLERKLSPTDAPHFLRRGVISGYDCRAADDSWRAWQARAQLAAPAGVLELLRRARSFVEDWDDDSQEFMDLCGDIDNAIAAAPSPAPASDVVQVPDHSEQYLDMVPRQLLERAADRLHSMMQADLSEELRALLNGGRV